MAQFYSNVLDINVNELPTMDWSEIVRRLVIAQDNGSVTLQRGGGSLNALHIASRIMRKENYLIAMINNDILVRLLKIVLLFT